MRSDRAFTLVEVLVVLAVLALLLTILMPALSHIRGSARVLICVENAQRIGKAMLNYAAENDGYVLRDYDHEKRSNADTDWRKYPWFGRYATYMGVDVPADHDYRWDRDGPGRNGKDVLLWDDLEGLDVLRCPALDHPHRLHYVVNAVSLHRQNPQVSYSESEHWLMGPVRYAQAPASPANLVCLAEVSGQHVARGVLQGRFDFHDMRQKSEVPFADGRVSDVSTCRMMHPSESRHGRSASLVFFDGHAGSVPLTPQDLPARWFNPGWD